MKPNELTVCACESAAKGGGLYRFLLSEDGKLQKGAYLPCDKPMYAAARERTLLALTLAGGKDAGESGILSVKRDLTSATSLGGTGGAEACHIAVSGKDFYLANYGSGSISKNGKTPLCHKGKGKDPERQEGPHTHCVLPAADGASLYVCDLGLDTLFLYDRDLRELSHAKVPAGYGIRHAVETRDGKTIFAINELSPSVSIFRRAGKRLSYEKTVSIPCRREGATGAAIRLSEDEKFLFVSIREEDLLLSFRVSEEKERGLSFCARQSSGGRWPRDFALVGDFLVAACERSDRLTVFPVRGGAIGKSTDSVRLPRPIAVLPH